MPSEDRPPFHLAFPCLDIPASVAFYRGLGATVGRHNEHAAILGFFGHQIVAHRVAAIEPQHGIYPRHFGVMVDLEVLDRIEADLRRLTPDTAKRTRFRASNRLLATGRPSGSVLGSRPTRILLLPLPRLTTCVDVLSDPPRRRRVPQATRSLSSACRRCYSVHRYQRHRQLRSGPIGRTVDAGLTPAMNADFGFVQLHRRPTRPRSIWPA